VIGRIPGPGRKLQGLELLIAPHIPPEDIDDVGRTRLVFGPGQPVEFVGEFLWYLDDAWHDFLPWYLNLNLNPAGVLTWLGSDGDADFPEQVAYGLAIVEPLLAPSA
jgi:hypothetical protein